MFGKNEVMHQDHGDGSSLRVVRGSPFLTIQGEGPYAGWPAVFIRLHGCNLRCIFCDTDFSGPSDPTVGVGELAAQAIALAANAKLFVVTGGEPLRQNILPLCTKLFGTGKRHQIETAGTLWVDNIQHLAELVVSPKTPLVHQMAEKHAMAYKYVIDVEQQLDGFIPITATQPGARPARLAAPPLGKPVYLSPMDTGNEGRNAANWHLVAKLAMKYGVMAGLQMHKFMQVD